MRYLSCTTTSDLHADYKKPISVYKSTDYRTISNVSHDYRPPHSQLFDCRVNVKTSKVENPVLSEDYYVTDNQRNYRAKKSAKNPLDLEAASNFFNVHYIRTAQEKMFRNPAPPIQLPASEAHEEYYQKPMPDHSRMVQPPNPYRICEMRAYGRDEQPPLKTEERSYFKLNDIYLTTNRQTYIPYTQQVQDGIARKDIITYYDGNGIPRGGKGYGPRVDVNIEPFVPRRVKPEPQKRKKKKMPTKMDSVPFFAYNPTTKDEYKPPTTSVVYPFLRSVSVEYKGVLANAGPWQTLAAPAMYCTEHCHIGTGWPVRSIIEAKTPVKEFVHCISLKCLCGAQGKSY